MLFYKIQYQTDVKIKAFDVRQVVEMEKPKIVFDTLMLNYVIPHLASVLLKKNHKELIDQIIRDYTDYWYNITSVSVPSWDEYREECVSLFLWKERFDQYRTGEPLTDEMILGLARVFFKMRNMVSFLNRSDRSMFLAKPVDYITVVDAKLKDPVSADWADPLRKMAENDVLFRERMKASDLFTILDYPYVSGCMYDKYFLTEGCLYFYKALNSNPNSSHIKHLLTIQELGRQDHQFWYRDKVGFWNPARGIVYELDPSVLSEKDQDDIQVDVQKIRKVLNHLK